jgi:hypothetical protein
MSLIVKGFTEALVTGSIVVEKAKNILLKLGYFLCMIF